MMASVEQQPAMASTPIGPPPDTANWLCLCGNHTTVSVKARTGPGMNKHGGVGWLVNYKPGNVKLFVKYALGGHEKDLTREHVSCNSEMEADWATSGSRGTADAPAPRPKRQKTVATTVTNEQPPPRTSLAAVKPSAVNRVVVAPASSKAPSDTNKKVAAPLSTKPPKAAALPSNNENSHVVHAKKQSSSSSSASASSGSSATQATAKPLEMKKKAVVSSSSSSSSTTTQAAPLPKPAVVVQQQQQPPPLVRPAAMVVVAAKAPAPAPPVTSQATKPAPAPAPAPVPVEKPKPPPARIMDYDDERYITFMGKMFELCGMLDEDSCSIPNERVLSHFKTTFTEAEVKLYLSMMEAQDKVFNSGGQVHFLY